MGMAPQRRPTVRIERHDLALPPDDQLALAIELDENRRSRSERKFRAAPGDLAAVASESHDTLVAAAERENHVVLISDRA